MIDALTLVRHGVFAAAKVTGQATAAAAETLAENAPSGFLTRRRRVAITGLAGTGKTVFLTTLINHLKHHEPSQFRLHAPPKGLPFMSRGKQQNAPFAIKQFAEDASEPGLGRFNHAIYARAMQSGCWPHKTVDVSAYGCHFSTDQHWLDYQVEYLDWPGERVADVVMFNRDYAEWSDRLLEYWSVSDAAYRQHVQPYLAAVSSEPLYEASILAEYRLAMGRLILDYKPLITPSCFLVGRDGNKLQGTSPEQLAEIGVAGISADSQFAPLTKQARDRQPGLAAIFAQRYGEYRDQIVCRLIESLKSCNRLIVLIDIPTILASGHGMLNDNHEMVEEMLAGLSPHTSKTTVGMCAFWNSIAPAQWMWSGVEKIAFVANKADVVAGEKDRDNLRRLLEDMLRTIVNSLEGVKVGYFVASPVNSTAHPSDESAEVNRLIGKPMYDAKGMRLPPDAPQKSFPVSRVPDKWPEHWSSGQFAFPEVYPSIPQGRFQLPKHINLDEVFQFILD